MMRRAFIVTLALSACSLLAANSAYAGTILKLGMGSDPPADLDFDGTTLATIDDGGGGTTGDQNTNVQFEDFLSFIPDILTPTASFTLDDLVIAGPADVIAGVLVVQDFTGGFFELYDPANVLLLSASLSTSTLTGPLGAPATGAVFTTSFGSVTGGTLAPLIDPNSISMSVSLTDINGGSGLSVSGGGGPAPALDPFLADVTLNIAAEIPEPATGLLLVLGGLIVGVFGIRRLRR